MEEAIQQYCFNNREDLDRWARGNAPLLFRIPGTRLFISNLIEAGQVMEGEDIPEFCEMAGVTYEEVPNPQA